MYREYVFNFGVMRPALMIAKSLHCERIFRVGIAGCIIKTFGIFENVN